MLIMIKGEEDTCKDVDMPKPIEQRAKVLKETNPETSMASLVRTIYTPG